LPLLVSKTNLKILKNCTRIVAMMMLHGYVENKKKLKRKAPLVATRTRP
jgi:hypothetical protein